MTRDEALELRYAVGSDVGRRRSANEDSAYATPLLAVADGMGGHAAGEVASAIAIEAIAALDDRLTDAGTGTFDPRSELASAIAEAAAKLSQRVEADPDLAGMGTTLTAMLWDGGATFGLAHIGDSAATCCGTAS
ncbi:PP2C family protein-serine/threonine phosphatase [Prauserella oleivorans]